jgi:hypothetical protein
VSDPPLRSAAFSPATHLQRDLLWAYCRIGDVLFRYNKPQEAIENYQAALQIGERLAATDPATRSGNARSRSITADRFVLNSQARLEEALGHITPRPTTL